MSKILVIDDSRLASALLKSAIQEYNSSLEVTLAKNGEEALAVIKNDSNFALIICDYNMPGMNGLELAEKLKDYLSYDKMAMCSANAAFQTGKLKTPDGMHLVTKPVTKDKLIPVFQKIGL